MTPREEILEALGEDFDGGVPTDINRIREILSRHELVPIDDTPFDPGRCGFKLNNIDVWEREGISISIFEDRMTIWGGSERVYFDGKLEMDRPVHSRGVALLKGLGLEVRT